MLNFLTQGSFFTIFLQFYFYRLRNTRLDKTTFMRLHRNYTANPFQNKFKPNIPPNEKSIFQQAITHAQSTPNMPKLSLSQGLMSQPPPNYGGVSQVSPVSMSALVSAVRSPAGGQLPPVSGTGPGLPPGLTSMPSMPGMPPMPNMPGSMSSMPSLPSMAGPIRRRISDKSTLSLAGGEHSFRFFFAVGSFIYFFLYYVGRYVDGSFSRRRPRLIHAVEY